MISTRSLEKSFPAFFGTGMIALASSIAASSIITGTLFASHPFINALRAFGLGSMAAGLTLWIALCRREGGSPTLDPLFALLIGGGLPLLLINVFAPMSPLSAPLTGIGLGLTLSGLLIGLAVQIIDPVYPSHLATTWPDGGVLHPDPHVPAIDLHRPEYLSVEPDDLTQIQGIGMTLQSILNQSGIVSYRDLLQYSPGELQSIVRSAHFRAPINPTMWRAQAESLLRARQSTQTRMA